MAKNTENQERIIYTKEQLLARKLSERRQKESLIDSLCDVMFRAVGRDFKWAKAHDKDDLHITDLVAMNWEQYQAFQADLIAIIMRQGSFSKKRAEHEADWFWFDMGLPRLDEQNIEERFRLTEEQFKKNLRFKIARYEEKNGPLTYEDGWEKELKAYAEYNNAEHES